MINGHTFVIQRIAAGTGYGGAGVYAGLSLTDIDLILRIAVGVISFLSIAVHLYFKIKNEKSKDRR